MATRKTGTKPKAPSKVEGAGAGRKAPVRRPAAGAGKRAARKNTDKHGQTRTGTGKKPKPKPKPKAPSSAEGAQSRQALSLPKGGVEGVREWGTLPQCLRWLEEAGYKLSQKNAHAHYGKSAAYPVRRDGKGRWYYPEFLERVRVNHGEQATDFPMLNKVATARQVAALRIATAEAKRREMQLAQMAGELVEWSTVRRVIIRAMQALQMEGKAASFALPEKLEGKRPAEQTQVIQDALHGVFGKLSQVFREMGRGEGEA